MVSQNNDDDDDDYIVADSLEESKFAKKREEFAQLIDITQETTVILHILYNGFVTILLCLLNVIRILCKATAMRTRLM
jgi:hypothetical protein